MPRDPRNYPRGVGNLSIEAVFDSFQGVSAPLVYQIRRTDGAGLMSTIGSVLTQIEVAEWLGAKPVVDLRHGSAYQEKNPINGTHNVWEYYFNPVSDISTDDVDSGLFRVLRSEEHHPIVKRDTNFENLKSLWKKYVRYNPVTSEAITRIVEDISVSSKTIGVHIRGGDMKTYPGHPLPPTLRQLVSATKNALDSSNFDSIFVAAQESAAVRDMRKMFGSRVIESPSFKVDSRESRAVTPFSGSGQARNLKSSEGVRAGHRYHLGLEVLQDVSLLSKCGTLVSGVSNVSQWASILSEGFCVPPTVVDNGFNSANRLIASLTWPVRRALPSRFGGFSR